jgi:hypothetical protein
MSTGTKVLLGLGIGCGVLVLLCCGGFFAVGYYFSRGISNDPNTVHQVAASIVEIEVPERLKPMASMDPTIPFVNRKIMSMAIFGEEKRHSALVLFQLDPDLAGGGSMRQQFEEAMKQQDNSQFRETELEDPQTFKTEINGAEAEFRYGKGKDQESKQDVWQAVGEFEGNGGTAMLFMQLNAEDFTEEQLVDVLKSMK